MMTILPTVLFQTAILSVIMALTGLICSLLLKDFRQFTLDVSADYHICGDAGFYGSQYTGKAGMDSLSSVLLYLYGAEKCVFRNDK